MNSVYNSANHDYIKQCHSAGEQSYNTIGFPRPELRDSFVKMLTEAGTEIMAAFLTKSGRPEEAKIAPLLTRENFRGIGTGAYVAGDMDTAKYISNLMTKLDRETQKSAL